MHEYTANVGFADWHARNSKSIPAGARMRMVSASDGGLEAVWELSDEHEQRDKFVSFIWAADGTPGRGSYKIVDRVTDETLSSGTIRSEDALVRVLTPAA